MIDVVTPHEHAEFVSPSLRSLLLPTPQGTLRPIFESRLKQKRSVRERAMVLRKKVAEAGVNYNELSGIYKAQRDVAKEVSACRAASASISPRSKHLVPPKDSSTHS